MKKFIPAIILFSVLLSACAPSEQSIQTAIAQTQVNQAAQTATLEKSILLSQTPTPAVTNTPTPTITPTPDIQIIDTDPQKMLCLVEDMPKDGSYFLPREWMGINTNTEVIGARGKEEGNEYVNKTGRVTGWWAVYQLSNRSKLLPYQIMCGTYLFKTNAGSDLAQDLYNDPAYNQKEVNWIKVDTLLNIGDKSAIYINRKIDNAGRMNTMYQLNYSYRNMNGTVVIYGFKEEEVSIEIAKEIAQKMMDRIKQLPLVDPGKTTFIKP